MFSRRNFIDHVLHRGYMTGIQRDRARVKATAEVFTPDDLVIEILTKIDELDGEAFTDHERTYCDPAAGDGQFIAWVLFFKLMRGDLSRIHDDELMDEDITEEYGQHLSTVYSVDIMPDNVELMRERILCGMEQYRSIVMRNIRCENALTYDFSFE